MNKTYKIKRIMKVQCSKHIVENRYNENKPNQYFPYLRIGLVRLQILPTLPLFMPGWSPAYLFEVVFVKCVCIRRTSVFFQFYRVLSGVIYNYSYTPSHTPPPFFFFFLLLLLFKVTKSHFCSRELCYWKHSEIQNVKYCVE